jgi:hypothetical protein
LRPRQSEIGHGREVGQANEDVAALLLILVFAPTTISAPLLAVACPIGGIAWG